MLPTSICIGMIYFSETRMSSDEDDDKIGGQSSGKRRILDSSDEDEVDSRMKRGKTPMMRQPNIKNFFKSNETEKSKGIFEVRN